MNRKAASLASVYSARAEPGATISTPLAWDEVVAGVDHRRFTMATVFARLAEVGDRFSGVLGDRQDLGPVLERLGIAPARAGARGGRMRGTKPAS